MFNQDRKQRKFITITTSIALGLLAPLANADVVLVPGHIVGNVQIGSESINYMRMRAYNSEDSADQNLSPNVTSASYDLTVNVPTGTTPNYTVQATSVRTNDSGSSNSDYFNFPGQVVVSNENTPVTADFELLNPNYVEGTVTLSGSGELRYMRVYAQPVISTGFSHYTIQYSDVTTRNSLDFEFPASTGDMRCYGTAYLLNGANISLASQTVSPVNGVINCDWSIDTPQVGQVEGTIGFTGPSVVNRFYVNTNGPTRRTWNPNLPNNPESYVLDDLSVGTYNLYSYAYLDNNDKNFTFPFSTYDPGRQTVIQAGDVDTIDILSCQTFIDGTVELIGAANWSDMNSGQILVSGLYNSSLPDGGPSYGGSASDRISLADGSYNLIVSPGEWHSNYLYLRPYNTDPADYMNEYMYIYERSVMYRDNPANLASCGDAVSQDYEYNMGSVTVNLSVSGGEVLSDPSLAGNCYEYDDNNVLQYQYYFSSTNSIQDNVTDGYVTFVAPQGNCTNLRAQAMVGGTQTTFGELDIEVIGGGEVIIDIGGPGLTIVEPEANLCIDDSETTISGTATDDVGVASVTVNGLAASLNPAGGEGTLTTDFSQVIALQQGANSIETIATDTSGKVGSDTRTVYRDSGAPSLSWLPTDGASTPLTSIDVSGIVSDDVGIDSVTVNGNIASLTSTGNPNEYSFNVSVPLALGSNNITVVVTEETGCAEVVEVRQVNVIENLPPVANAGGPYSVDEGSSISLDGSASSDPDADPITFEWDFDYDGITFEVDAAGSATPSFSAAALDGPGNVSVAVWINDSEGESDVDDAEVTVNNVAPTATLNAPVSVNEGEDIFLSMTSPFDPSADDTTAGFEYSFDCGAGYGAFSASSSVLCVTTDNETSPVGSKIRDKDGDETEYAASVMINNVAPIATLEAPVSVNEGEDISLSMTSPYDPSSTDTTAGFEYSFDCGSGYGAFSTSNSVSCPTTDDEVRAIGSKIRDKDGAQTGYTANVTINNVAPTANLEAPVSVNEGENISLSLTGSFDPSSDDATAGFEYSFDCGNGYGAYSASSSALCPTTDNESRTVGGKIRDKDGDATGYTASVTVINVAPTATLVAPENVNEGQEFPLSLTNPFDPSSDDTTAGFEYSFDCGDGYSAYGSSTSTTCTTSDDDARIIGGKIRDTDGGETEYTASVLVDNVAPVISSVTGDAIYEDGTATVSGTFSDVGLPDSFTVMIDWGEGSPESFAYAAGSTGFSETHQYLDDNPIGTASDNYDITVTVTDDDAGSASDSSADVLVDNVAPEVSAITVDVDLVEMGMEIMASATFTDTGLQDTHSATWNWGDDSSAGTVTQGSGGGSVEDTHTYNDPGVYTIELTVTDDDSGSVSVIYQYVVVYDPDGSFVTGGGKIESPPGAWVDDPSLTGMANFGFVSKYKKGANIPTGHTEFQFQTAGLDFKSTEYQWLVVAGARAKFKGTGTIKHLDGSFGFMLTAIDGAISGGGGADKFRIKIWDASDESLIVYDNELGVSDDADATTVINSGSIVIHKKGKK